MTVTAPSALPPARQAGGERGPGADLSGRHTSVGKLEMSGPPGMPLAELAGPAVGLFGAGGREPLLRPLPAQGQAGRDERSDVLAYFDRRIGNAETIAASVAADAATREIAEDRALQMKVMRQEIAHGLHEGAAALAADLARGAAR